MKKQTVFDHPSCKSHALLVKGQRPEKNMMHNAGDVEGRLGQCFY